MLARTEKSGALLSAPLGAAKSGALLSANGKRKKSGALLIAEIDRRRRAGGVSVGRLCRAANVIDRVYRLGMRGGPMQQRTLRKLSDALDALAANRTPIAIDVVAALTATSFRAFFNATCLRMRIKPIAARAELAKAGEHTADPAWREASRARGIALYLTNTAQGVRQGDLARLTGLSPAAVSIAIAKVADALDGRFEAMLDKIERDVTGKV